MSKRINALRDTRDASGPEQLEAGRRPKRSKTTDIDRAITTDRPDNLSVTNRSTRRSSSRYAYRDRAPTNSISEVSKADMGYKEAALYGESSREPIVRHVGKSLLDHYLGTLDMTSRQKGKPIFEGVRFKMWQGGSKLWGPKFDPPRFLTLLTSVGAYVVGADDDKFHYFIAPDHIFLDTTPTGVAASIDSSLHAPLSWVQECLDKNIHVDRDLWQNQRSQPVSDASATLAPSSPIVGLGGTLPGGLPSTAYPPGGFTEFQSLRDRTQGADILRSMSEYDWTGKTKKDFYDHWKQTRHRDIASFCKRYKARIEMECREFADRSQQVIAERSRSMRRTARERAVKTHVEDSDGITRISGKTSTGEEAEHRTTTCKEAEPGPDNEPSPDLGDPLIQELASTSDADLLLDLAVGATEKPPLEMPEGAIDPLDPDAAPQSDVTQYHDVARHSELTHSHLQDDPSECVFPPAMSSPDSNLPPLPPVPTSPPPSSTPSTPLASSVQPESPLRETPASTESVASPSRLVGPPISPPRLDTIASRADVITSARRPPFLLEDRSYLGELAELLVDSPEVWAEYSIKDFDGQPVVPHSAGKKILEQPLDDGPAQYDPMTRAILIRAMAKLLVGHYSSDASSRGSPGSEGHSPRPMYHLDCDSPISPDTQPPLPPAAVILATRSVSEASDAWFLLAMDTTSHRGIYCATSPQSVALSEVWSSLCSFFEDSLSISITPNDFLRLEYPLASPEDRDPIYECVALLESMCIQSGDRLSCNVKESSSDSFAEWVPATKAIFDHHDTAADSTLSRNMVLLCLQEP